MPTLNLTIRWLTDEPGVASYHGQEWPPSPARVFRALLAGACRPGGAGERGIRALERLEGAGPPVIVGQQAERLAPVKSAVPNNDGDRIFELYQKGAPVEARKRASKLKTLRSRQGWAVSAPVQYHWRFTEADPDPEAFLALANGLSILGQGTDLACAEAVWLDEEPKRVGYSWLPDEILGEEAMPVPSEGEVKRLVRQHQSELRRVDGPHIASIREAPVAMATYRDPLSPPPARWQAFALRTFDDTGSLAIPGREAMRVAGMVRHAIDQAARVAGLDDETRTEIMGHGGSARLGVLPVPNIAHQWADGRIRRVIVRAPVLVSESIWAQIINRLTAAELVEKTSGQARGLLVPITNPGDDSVLRCFTSQSTNWTSATPLILPGFDKRRGKSRSGKILQRILHHAQIPEASIRRVRLDHAPATNGVQAAAEVEVPHYLERFPRKFISIEFHRPVSGPLILGAGRWAGLGTLVQAPTREPRG
jgi:CRISPR-associated protein Csb2